MGNPTEKTQEEIDSELLTAYLDGELADADCIVVEKRLAEDSSFHAQMRDLQSAWEMLDSLPLVRPNSHFVQTTIEMAIHGNSAAKKPWMGIILKSVLLLTLLLAIPAAVFMFSFLKARESIEQIGRAHV